jgi:hypothetical protein
MDRLTPIPLITIVRSSRTRRKYEVPLGSALLRGGTLRPSVSGRGVLTKGAFGACLTESGLGRACVLNSDCVFNGRSQGSQRQQSRDRERGGEYRISCNHRLYPSKYISLCDKVFILDKAS